jgi:hypothetical protein
LFTSLIFSPSSILTIFVEQKRFEDKSGCGGKENLEVIFAAQNKCATTYLLSDQPWTKIY